MRGLANLLKPPADKFPYKGNACFLDKPSGGSTNLTPLTFLFHFKLNPGNQLPSITCTK